MRQGFGRAVERRGPVAGGSLTDVGLPSYKGKPAYGAARRERITFSVDPGEPRRSTTGRTRGHTGGTHAVDDGRVRFVGHSKETLAFLGRLRGGP